jgi:hypothetical protein
MANPYDEGQHPLGHAVWRALAAATSGELNVAGLTERLKAHPSAAVAKITKSKVCCAALASLTSTGCHGTALLL